LKMKNNPGSKLLISIFYLMMLTVTSCSQLVKEKPAAPDKPIILLLLKDYDNEFYRKIDEGFRSGMTPYLKNNYQLDLRYGSNESDIATQGRELKHYIADYASAKPDSRLKIAVITPVAGNNDIATQIKPLNDDNIPIVIVDLAIDPAALARAHSHYDVFIGSANKLGGKLAADEMAKHLPHGGTILLLNGVAGAKIAMGRADGFVSRLTELGKQNSADYKIIERAANYTRSEAQSIVSSLLKMGVSPDGVFAVNDQMALGCLEALRQAQYDRIVVVIGFDAIKEAVDAVKDGRLAATIVQDPFGMGQKAAIAVDKILHHEATDKKILLSPKLISDD